jgi:hypothetical protein
MEAMRGRRKRWTLGPAVAEEGGTTIPQEGTRSNRPAILLSMAMFVLVVDTSLMNASISAVVRDLGTTVSGVQSAIALEALVSAAGLLGLFNEFRMVRVSERAATRPVEGVFG